MTVGMSNWIFSPSVSSFIYVDVNIPSVEGNKLYQTIVDNNLTYASKLRTIKQSWINTGSCAFTVQIGRVEKQYGFRLTKQLIIFYMYTIKKIA